MWFEEVLEVSELHMEKEERMQLQELYHALRDELGYFEREEARTMQELISRGNIQLNAEEFKIFSNFVTEAERILGYKPSDFSLRFTQLLWKLEDCLGLNVY